MSSRREVLIRIARLIETKNHKLNCLKWHLPYCSINEECCRVDRGRGICPLFSSTPQVILQCKSLHPQEFAIQGKKNANARGSGRRGRGGGVGLGAAGVD